LYLSVLMRNNESSYPSSCSRNNASSAVLIKQSDWSLQLLVCSRNNAKACHYL